MEKFDNFHNLNETNAYDEVQSTSYAASNSNIQNPYQTSYIPEDMAPIPSSYLGRIKMIQPPIYDGVSDPVSWLSEYEMIAEANHWDNKDKVNQLIFYLRGSS